MVYAPKLLCDGQTFQEKLRNLFIHDYLARGRGTQRVTEYLS